MLKLLARVVTTANVGDFIAATKPVARVVTNATAGDVEASFGDGIAVAKEKRARCDGLR